MPPHLVQVAIYSVVSFLVGGAVAWRMLGRGHRGYSRKLAEELTDSVHDRCSAYRKLEDRIDTAIAEFERRDAELRNELAGMSAEPGEPTAPQLAESIAGTTAGTNAGTNAGTVVTESSVAEGTMVEGDALSWMDACDGPGGAMQDDAGRTAFVGLPLPEAGKAAFVGAPLPEERPAVEDTGNVVEQITRGLEVMQREKSAELAGHRGRLDDHDGRLGSLESRVQMMETSIQGLRQLEPSRAARADATRIPGADVPGIPTGAATIAADETWARSLQEIHERLLRSERELAAWRAEHERWSRERLACIESAREIAARIAESRLRNPEAEAAATSVRARAEELARETAKLQAAISRREVVSERPIAPGVRPATDMAPKPAADLTPRVAPVEALRETQAPPARVEPGRPAPREASSAPRTLSPAKPAIEDPSRIQREEAARSQPARPLPAFEDIASLVDAMPAPIPAPIPVGADASSGGSSQISQLMRNLEIAQGEAEKYRRKLHEQSTQFTAAYAMLDRIRPFVQALESEYAAQTNPRHE